MKLFNLPLLAMLSMLLICSTACKKSEEKSVPPTTDAFYDEYGRTLILHGASLYTNDNPGGYSRYTDEGARRMIEDWGLNNVRMFWNWVSIMPDSGVLSNEALERLAGIVETFTRQGVYVVLAVNGTVTNSQSLVTGTWAAPSGNAPNIPDLPGPANPAVQEAMRRWWDYDNFPYLQDEFIRASIFVAKRFENNPYVLGYDIVNEPWGNSFPRSALTKELEAQLLPEFYDRYITRMRAEIPDKYIFFEPAVMFNSWETSRFITNLPFIPDNRPAGRKLSFSPHLYLPHVNSPIRQNPYVNTLPIYLRNVAVRYERIRRIQKTPIYIGEWSYIDINSFRDWENFLNSHMALFDSLQYSWSFFNYIPGASLFGGSLAGEDDVEEPRLVNKVSRVYPMVTAGSVNRFKYDPSSKVFEMEFINNPSISQPTEIFIPRRHYPNGWDLKVEGTKDYSYEYDEARQLLKLTVKNAAAVKVVIEAK